MARTKSSCQSARRHGEVNRARDTKLERDVAIKVLPDELAADEERVARFEREAKLLASLNHPNIVSIYGFESGIVHPDRRPANTKVKEDGTDASPATNGRRERRRK